MSEEFYFIERAIKTWITEHEAIARSCRSGVGNACKGLTENDRIHQAEFSEKFVRQSMRTLDLIADVSLTYWCTLIQKLRHKHGCILWISPISSQETEMVIGWSFECEWLLHHHRSPNTYQDHIHHKSAQEAEKAAVEWACNQLGIEVGALADKLTSGGVFEVWNTTNETRVKVCEHRETAELCLNVLSGVCAEYEIREVFAPISDSGNTSSQKFDFFDTLRRVNKLNLEP